MINRLGIHAANHAPFIGFASHVRHQLAEPVATLAVLGELEHRRSHREVFLARCHGRQPLAFANGLGEVFAAHLLHLRFWVEEIELRGSTRLEEVDDALGFRFEIREAESVVGGEARRAHERAEGREADAARGAFDEGPTGERHARRHV